MVLDIKNQGVTNSSACVTKDNDFDSKKLFDRYSIEKRILDLCNNGKIPKKDLKHAFNSICNDLYTVIKCSRNRKFNEDFWEDWK